MSLLGIDVGTTGCKAAVFSTRGAVLSLAYAEYDIQRPQPGWAELDSNQAWQLIKNTIASAVAQAGDADPVTALSVSSLGEAVVPVRADRSILGASLLNFDARGETFLPSLRQSIDRDELYRVNGNTLGNQYGLTKLLWIKTYRPEIYARADFFLHWSSFVAFMLGAEPAVDFSLANRTLLFDLEARTWSPRLVALAGLDLEKLPRAVPSGACVGTVSPAIAAQLGLPAGVAILSGAHDQCANAVGCGVIHEGMAVYGMGTYHCITPVYSRRQDQPAMLSSGLGAEHHAVPGKYVSFIYNQGGSLVKWYRDTFAHLDHLQAKSAGLEIYTELIREVPHGPSQILVLPHFAPTGPPEFIDNSSGVILGLRLETSRGAILKGLLESITFSLKEIIDRLPSTGIDIHEYRVSGGGSKSDAWIQICADILDQPFIRPRVTEAGCLGAAMMAAVGSAQFTSYDEAASAMITLDHTFEPDPRNVPLYQEQYQKYIQLWPLLRSYLTHPQS
jgi:xylulokinase